MKACAKYVLCQLLVLMLAVPAAFAQDKPPADAPAFTQAELDQMLAPIALYPDSLLSQILMAATYPLEAVEAARWSKEHPDIKGADAVKAVDDRNWDPSVKSLVAFPQILSMMDEKLDWTERLGDAFLGQQSQVMDTVQSLRQKADAAGNLKTNDHYRVEHEGQTIVVESAYPDVVYVPYYDPLVVYGTWWWPAYRPVYWRPWPGYYVRPGFTFYWGIGITIGHGFFFGAWDWPHRSIRIVEAHPFYYHYVDHRPIPVRHVWVHEPEHRRGVRYRSVEVQKRYVHVNTPQVRREYPSRSRSAPSGRQEHDTRSGHDNRSVGDTKRIRDVNVNVKGDDHGSRTRGDSGDRDRKQDSRDTPAGEGRGGSNTRPDRHQSAPESKVGPEHRNDSGASAHEQEDRGSSRGGRDGGNEHWSDSGNRRSSDASGRDSWFDRGESRHDGGSHGWSANRH